MKIQVPLCAENIYTIKIHEDILSVCHKNIFYRKKRNNMIGDTLTLNTFKVIVKAVFMLAMINCNASKETSENLQGNTSSTSHQKNIQSTKPTEKKLKNILPGTPLKVKSQNPNRTSKL